MDFSSALSGLGTALTLARTAVDARDDAKIRSALADMSDRLMALHVSALGYRDEIEQLKADQRDLHQKLVDRERYVLQQVSPGRFALRYQPTGDDPTPVHHICQACHGRGRKVVLQYIQSAMYGAEFVCPDEKGHGIYVGSETPYTVVCATQG